jgi:hypothetical protein
MMFWAYFDESGWHSKRSGGGLRKLTIGGCLAEEASWRRLSIDWAAALERRNIELFHMVDFEARRPPFDTWTEPERRDRLNTLLDMIGETKAHCYGFTNIIRESDNTAKIYERCVYDTFLELNMNVEEFHVFFAHHPEYGRQVELLNKMVSDGMRQQIKSCSIAKPIDIQPLQAADIVAYEICREERDEFRRRRYPLNRLSELGCTFRLGSSVD